MILGLGGWGGWEGGPCHVVDPISVKRTTLFLSLKPYVEHRFEHFLTYFGGDSQPILRGGLVWGAKKLVI